MSVDPYTDPATGLLRNKLGITDRDELAAAEADITTARLARLTARPIPGPSSSNSVKTSLRWARGATRVGRPRGRAAPSGWV